MKKIFMLLMIISLLVIMSGCNQTDQDTNTSGQVSYNEEDIDPFASKDEAVGTSAKIDNEGEIINITEKMYVTYINDIYTNLGQYQGKTIKIEGMYTSQHDDQTGKDYYLVYRTGPGCCGNDGSMCGFEFTTEGDLPEDNDWIEVIGTLESYEENGYTYLTLSNSKVTIKQERGLEVVTQ